MPPKRKAGDEQSAPKKMKANRLLDRLCSLKGHVYDEYDVMLNQTNIAGNNNKFYVIQMIESGGSYYVWNRWGRVGEDGQSALQGPFDDVPSAKKNFEQKFKDKTKNDWSKRGSFKPHEGKYSIVELKSQVAPPAAPAKGKKGKKAAEEEEEEEVVPKKKAVPCKLPKGVQDLVSYIFDEAKKSLVSSIDCSLTENGIETPLGVLSVDQIKKGEDILDDMLKELKKAKKSKATLESLSSAFYTAIPHRFGRSRPPVIDNLVLMKEKNDLLELMRDMVHAVSKNKKTLSGEDVQAQYDSLGCTIEQVLGSSKEFKDIVKEIKQSIEESHDESELKVKNVYRVTRAEERKAFKASIPNHKRLYHGSRISNWVGLLSRGILMPKVVVSLGVNRTDEGWLGNGIYFGHADTAAGYAGASDTRGTAFMLMVTVALGKMKDYEEITYGLTSPPKGFDSCHGVQDTEFDDHEFVIYDGAQQQIEYLIEFEEDF